MEEEEEEESTCGVDEEWKYLKKTFFWLCERYVRIMGRGDEEKKVGAKGGMRKLGI